MHHDNFARDNGFDPWAHVIETGLLIEGRPVIETCKNKAHQQRREFRQSYTAQGLKARQVQSLYAYGIARQGD